MKYEVFPCCQVDDVNMLEWYMFYNNATVDSLFKEDSLIIRTNALK